MSTTSPPPDRQPDAGMTSAPATDRSGSADDLRTQGDPSTPGQSQPEPDSSDGAQRPQDGAQDERERGEDGRLLSREAAGYRRRLREAEGERDALQARVDALQTAQVEQLARAAGLAAPADVWAFGGQLEFMRDENGGIDEKIVAGAVNDILRDRPGLRNTNGNIGVGLGGAAGTRQRNVSFSELLKPGRS